MNEQQLTGNILERVWNEYALKEDEGRPLTRLFSQSPLGRKLYDVLQVIGTQKEVYYVGDGLPEEIEI